MRRAVMETDIDANLWPPRRRSSNRRARPGWRRRARGSRGRGGPGPRSPASAASRASRASAPARPEREEALQPQHPVQRLRPVAERGQAPAVQLPLGPPRPPRQLRDHPRPAPHRCRQPAADGDRDGVDGRRVGEPAAMRRPAPPPARPRRRPGPPAPPRPARARPAAPAGRAVRTRAAEHGRRRAGPEPHRRDLDPGWQPGSGRTAVRPGHDQLATDHIRSRQPSGSTVPAPPVRRVQVQRRCRTRSAAGGRFRVHAGDAAGGHRQSRAR